MKRYASQISLHPVPLLNTHACFLTKAETINWFLKKKSGTRNWHNPLASAGHRMPVTLMVNGTPAQGEVDEDENAQVGSPPVFEVIPTRYHGPRHYDPSPWHLSWTECVSPFRSLGRYCQQRYSMPTGTLRWTCRSSRSQCRSRGLWLSATSTDARWRGSDEA